MHTTASENFDRYMRNEFAALEEYQLVPKVLYENSTVDTSFDVVGTQDLRVDTPIVVQATAHSGVLSTGISATIPATMPQKSQAHTRVSQHLQMVDGIRWLEQLSDTANPPLTAAERRCLVPALTPDKMGALMPLVRRWVKLEPAALALDLTQLAYSEPFGDIAWHPRSKEDVAELCAAAGVPVWLYGVGSVHDAEIASDAGVTAIVVNSGTSRFLGGPATIDIFPDIFDAVAGTLAIYAGGPVRSGIDVFRYLAVGAEAVVVQSERHLWHLQQELIYAMRLTACTTLADIGYDAIFTPLFDEI